MLNMFCRSSTKCANSAPIYFTSGFLVPAEHKNRVPNSVPRGEKDCDTGRLSSSRPCRTPRLICKGKKRCIDLMLCIKSMKTAAVRKKDGYHVIMP